MSIILSSNHEYRGYLINEFTKLEKAIDQHLLSNFFPLNKFDKIYEMHEVLLDRMTFDGKRTAVKGILDKRSISGGFMKTRNNSYPHGKLFDEIRQLIEFRNYFAHYLCVEDFGEYTISLLQFRDRTTILRYSQEDFDSLVDRIIKATSDILSLLPDGSSGL
ncbi:hypothetical protein HDF24_15020 [Mucilaginibacter sp. X4EP1]|uniref:hypothetical protein n=1 Tax=Mucilaginibacter sp. X4EP1 TaxID=2723092 RepID=UPI00216A5CC8|nr:hypothetical protein [Mucilaginibacter sp. X4EP1]MCS3815393.1 hypothetical protein [Mucilaginibacter sp. X4EP1]